MRLRICELCGLLEGQHCGERQSDQKRPIAAISLGRRGFHQSFCVCGWYENGRGPQLRKESGWLVFGKERERKRMIIPVFLGVVRCREQSVNLSGSIDWNE